MSPDTGSRFAAPVADLLARHELELLETAAQALRGDQTRSDWEATSLARIRLWRAQAERGVAGALAELGVAVRAALLGAQREGAATALVDLPGEPAAQPQGMRGVLLSERRLGAQLAAALQSAPRLLEATLREAVRAGVDDVRAGKVTRRTASQQVLDKLVAQGVTGFRDKAGRNWSLSTYTEMSVRTETQARALAAGDEAIKAVGLDLVIVSDSPRECPLCRPFEGKVLALGELPRATPPRGENVQGDTPVSPEIAGILNKWVQLRGSGNLTRKERGSLGRAVLKDGEKAPGLFRGSTVPKRVKFAPGQAMDFGPRSTSEDADAAEPYAGMNDGAPVVFKYLNAKGLNVQNRAEESAGYGEKEWIVSGRMYVRHAREIDGVLTVTVSPVLESSAEAQRNARKKPLDMDSLEDVRVAPDEEPPPGPAAAGPATVTRTNELTGEPVKVDVYMTLDEARANGFQHPNCTHSYSGYQPGITKLEPAKSNPEGYEAKQRQRALERQVRSAKRAEALALDPTAKAQARARVRDRQAQLRTHVKEKNLKRQPGRESVAKAV